MDKICRICNKERQYDDYQNLYKGCIKCNVRCSVKNFYAKRDKKNWKRGKNIVILTEKKLLIRSKLDDEP